MGACSSKRGTAVIVNGVNKDSKTILSNGTINGTIQRNGKSNTAARSGSESSTQESNSLGEEQGRTSTSTTTDRPTLETPLKRASMHRSSSSRVGLDTMVEERRETGDLRQNVVRFEVPFGKPIEEVYDGVHDGRELGSGISGIVRQVTHRATGLQYAVKILELSLVDSGENLTRLREEISVMCELDHPNIVRLEEVYESQAQIYLVQELCLGGELFDRLDEQPDFHYTESDCAALTKQMLCAVRYLHSHGIIHRDLKLENFLFSSKSKDSELKMIDFGLSKHFTNGEVQRDPVGTPYTVAPEVLRGCYGEKCDIWAIGVITYLLLSGEAPFGGCGSADSMILVRDKILNCNYQFEPVDIWARCSVHAKDFIRDLLKKDPKDRPTAREAQLHPWLREWTSRRNIETNNILDRKVLQAFVSFQKLSGIRRLLCEVLSFTLLPNQVKRLRREFEKMDIDGSGEISLAEFRQGLGTNNETLSEGTISNEEIECIFNAMRVRKSQNGIHWHEFIAASLSECRVDERNLRLAFDRLDSNHKGFIVPNDILDLLGSDGFVNNETLQQMWSDEIRPVCCHHNRIVYEDFLSLMEGTSSGICKIDTITSEVVNSRETSETNPSVLNEYCYYNQMCT